MTSNRFFLLRKKYRILLVFLITYGISLHSFAQHGDYYNPVIKGDFPDPSIIRVDDEYYAVGTSNDFAPNYPIYSSSDLINWTRLGSVFDEPPAWASDDFWAPELFYRDGTYYMYYTTKRKDTRIACIGVATTKDLTSGFTDHGILIEWGEEAIDAYVFQDGDNKLYITWKAYGLTPGRDIEILASELSSDGLGLVGDHWTLTDHTAGWKGSGDEGQAIVKRGGYYYMLYSVGGCCDNQCDYSVMVSRSKDLRSGWEQYPEPILQGGEEWRCPGHGTLVQAADSRDFYLYHAYNAKDFEFIGRQGMLDELLWDDKTGWPHFKNGNTPSEKSKVPFSGTRQEAEGSWEDDFSRNTNLDFWEWDVNVPKPGSSIENGKMWISSSHDGVNFLGLRPKEGDYSMVAEISLTDARSGIGIYSNQANILGFTSGRTGLEVFKVEKGTRKLLAGMEAVSGETLFLKYESIDGRYYKFYWSPDKVQWHSMQMPETPVFDAAFIAQWGFSPRVGFIVDGQSSKPSGFEAIEIHYTGID